MWHDARSVKALPNFKVIAGSWAKVMKNFLRCHGAPGVMIFVCSGGHPGVHQRLRYQGHQSFQTLLETNKAAAVTVLAATFFDCLKYFQ